MRKTISTLPGKGLQLGRTGAGWGAYFYQRRLLPLYRGTIKFLGRLLPWMLSAGLGYFMARTILTTPVNQIIVIILSLIGGAAFCARPELSVIAIIAATSTIANPGAIPKPFTVAGQGFGAVELLILMMLPVLFVRVHANRNFRYPASPVTLPLLMWFVAVLVSIGVTFYQYQVSPRGPFPFKEVYNAVRPMFYYLTFFIVVLAVDTKEKLRLVLRALTWMACIVAVLMVAQYLLGTRTQLFIGSAFSTGPEVQGQTSQDSDIARPIPPGVAIVLLVFAVAVATSAYRSLREGLLNSVVGGLLGLALLLTYARGFWIATFVSLLVIWIGVNRAAKWRLGIGVVTTLVGAAVLGVMISAVAPGEAGQKFAANMEERFSSIFEEKTLQSSSLQYRFSENRYAIEQIKKNPIFGVGAGAPIGYDYVKGPGGRSVFIVPKQWMHNSYLELYMVHGLLGVVSVVWLTVAFLLRCHFVYKRLTDPAARVLALSIAAVYVGFVLRCVTAMALLHEVHNMTIAAVMWGLVEAVWRAHGTESPSVETGGAEKTPAPEPSSRVLPGTRMIFD